MPSFPPRVVVAVAVTGCGSSGSGIKAPDATSFFRQQVAKHYHAPVATNDGRGCLPTSPNHYACTAYARGQNRDIDVVGTVIVTGGANGFGLLGQ